MLSKYICIKIIRINSLSVIKHFICSDNSFCLSYQKIYTLSWYVPVQLTQHCKNCPGLVRRFYNHEL